MTVGLYSHASTCATLFFLPIQQVHSRSYKERKMFGIEMSSIIFIVCNDHNIICELAQSN